MDTLKTTKSQYTASSAQTSTSDASSSIDNTPLEHSIENPIESPIENPMDAAAVLHAHQRQFVAEHSTCAMCDTTLEIRHEINKNELKIKEEAHCPSCGIRVRSSHHLMQ
jgi:hypothetical protein